LAFESYVDVWFHSEMPSGSSKTGLISHHRRNCMVDCILLATSSMPTQARQTFAFFVFALLAAAAPALAQDAWQPRPHVRPDAGVRDLVEDATRRSPAIRELRDQLETLDVTVYIRTRAFTVAELEGRVAPLSSNGAHRYLVIELACARSELSQMTALGHELHHAVEIAREPSIVDARTLAAYYARVGIQIGDSDGKRTFETTAAAAAGTRVRRDVLTSRARNNNGT
jgi:hypothetical protein